MTNLLEETITFLNDQNLNIDDILFVTNGKQHMSVDEFCFHAKQIDYDNGYGGAEINLSLKLVGKNFWIERDEYDGSEWWTLKTIPDISLFEKGTFLIKTGDTQNILQMQTSYQKHIIEEAFKKTISNKINGTIRKLNDKNGFPYLFIEYDQNIENIIPKYINFVSKDLYSKEKTYEEIQLFLNNPLQINSQKHISNIISASNLRKKNLTHLGILVGQTFEFEFLGIDLCHRENNFSYHIKIESPKFKEKLIEHSIHTPLFIGIAFNDKEIFRFDSSQTIGTLLDIWGNPKKSLKI